MKKTALLATLAVLVLEAGCMMGPKYKRPTVDVPQEYRAPAPEQAAQASSLGNEQWWQVYQDPVLTQLIHTAIAQNYDVRIAAARVPVQKPSHSVRPGSLRCTCASTSPGSSTCGDTSR